MEARPEDRESLWWLAAAPTIWAAHFLTTYILVSVWCYKVVGRDGALGPVGWGIVGLTAVALVGIGLIGRHALRRHRFGSATLPHDFDTQGDRHRFLGFATLLLAGVSALAVLFVALPFLFIGGCR